MKNPMSEWKVEKVREVNTASEESGAEVKKHYPYNTSSCYLRVGYHSCRVFPVICAVIRLFTSSVSLDKELTSQNDPLLLLLLLVPPVVTG